MLKKIENGLEKKLNELFESEAFQNTMKGIKETDADYKFSVVVTTEGVDRDGETIKADWIEMERYMKNPVVLANHEYKIESIVWKTLKLTQNENGETIAEGVFAKWTEKAELCRTLYNQGFIKTVSIWFIPKQRAENDRSIITASEMLEFSFVAVPANPEALSLDWKVYKKALAEGLIKEVETVNVTASELKEGDLITYRHKETWQKEDWTLVENVYPSYDKLPRMGKLIQKLEANEEILTWGNEAIIATAENPVLTIHDHVRSKDGPKTRTSNIFLKEYDELVIEKIVTAKEFEDGEVKFANENEVDLKEVLHNIKELKEDFSEMKKTLKAFSDDKEEKTNLEKSRKAGQELAKSLSAYLKEAKDHK